MSCVQSVYRWMNGCSLPTIDHLYALSELFRIPIDQMLVGNRTYQSLPYRDSFYVRMRGYCNLIVEISVA